ncbi:MAG: CotH kinase family protein [Bacteroidales bacterium]|nr:CotH kinase family protein [Bacteroidales bacterium]
MNKKINLSLTLLALLFFHVAYSQNESSLSFSVQPQNKCLLQGESCTLTCAAECESSTVYYRWYLTNDNGTTTTPITNSDWSTSPDLEIEPFAEKGIRYYVCGASIDKTNITFSDVVATAYSDLPILVIETINHEEPTAEPVYSSAGVQITIINETKVPSSMKIYKGGVVIYDSGEYIEKTSGLTIKLRGNSTARLDKKPYKIKLQKKADLLAIIDGQKEKSKDKEWVLLNYANNLTTFIGNTVADYAGQPWTPKLTYVNVVMNGEYRGIYTLIEAVKQSETRINISDEGYIIERDPFYRYETVSFKTDRGLPYTFEHPDEDDVKEDQTLLSFIKDYMNTVETQISNGSYEDYIDVSSFARWNLIHDLIGTKDGGGSNQFYEKYDKTTPDNPYEDGSWSKLKMSSIWDLSSIMSTPDAWANNHAKEYNYSDWLFANPNNAFFDSYQEQWNQISTGVWPYLSAKLTELQTTFGEDINIARMLDARKWNTSYTKVEKQIQAANTWFTTRVAWLDNKINHLLAPDFSTLEFQTEKQYDGTVSVDFSGNIDIHNSSYINDGDEVSIKITSIHYDAATTDAQKIIIQFELDGRDKDNYELTYTQHEFPAKILPIIEEYGALTIITDQDGTRAEINASSNESLAITSSVAVDKVIYKRTFDGSRTSTIMLPFDFDASEVDGSFYTLASYEWKDNVATLTMSNPITEIKANTPYIFKPNKTLENIVFDRDITLQATSEIEKNGTSQWQLIGVYDKKVWTEQKRNEYGFAGTDDDANKIKAGEFVWAGIGASIKTTRCYLQHVDGLSKSSTKLPERIIVLFPNEIASVIEQEHTNLEIEEQSDDRVEEIMTTEDLLTPVAENMPNSITKVWSYDKTIYIATLVGQTYKVIDLNGRMLKNGVTSSDREEVRLNFDNCGIVIVITGNKSYKIMY